MRTDPVKFASGPLIEGCDPARLSCMTLFSQISFSYRTDYHTTRRFVTLACAHPRTRPLNLLPLSRCNHGMQPDAIHARLLTLESHVAVIETSTLPAQVSLETST